MATLPSKPFFLEKMERRVKDNFPARATIPVQDREEKDMAGACSKIMAQTRLKHLWPQSAFGLEFFFKAQTPDLSKRRSNGYPFAHSRGNVPLGQADHR
jgi:hypothetical protein